MNSEFVHVDSPQMKQVVRLASEAVISSSLLAIMGSPGSGKTHAARMLARKWSNHGRGQEDESMTFQWKVTIFYCNAVSDLKTRLEKLIRLINPRQKVSNHRVPYLVESLAASMKGDPSLLYLDNAHLLGTAERLSILEAVQMAREINRVGLVMSTLEHQPAFEGLLKDPRALAEIRLMPLKAEQALFSMTFYDSRFESWWKSYEKGDREARELAQDISKHINGSFARLVQLRDSLAHHVEGDTLTWEDVQKVIALRTP
jgi:hypothetical protein